MSYNYTNEKVHRQVFFYRLRRFRFELRIFFQIVQFLCLVLIFQIQIVHGFFVCDNRGKKSRIIAHTAFNRSTLT